MAPFDPASAVWQVDIGRYQVARWQGEVPRLRTNFLVNLYHDEDAATVSKA